MKCNEADNLIMKHMDGELNDIENIQLMKHLDECQSCKNEFKNVSCILKSLNEKIEVEPPEDFEKSIMMKVEVIDVHKKKNVERNLLIGYFMASMTIAIFFIIVGTLYKDSISSIMTYVGISKTIVHGTYNVFVTIDNFLKLLKHGLVFSGYFIGDMYYVGVGLVTIVLFSKMYETFKAQSSSKKEII